MPEFKLEITSIEGIIFSENCYLVVIPSTSGEIGIMKDHEAILANLTSGDIKIFDKNNNIIKSINISAGYAEMESSDKLNILIKT